MHRDHVPAVPPPFHLLGSTAVSPNQGMVRLYPAAAATAPADARPADVQIFTVQGHPEFHRAITDEIVKARRAGGLFDDALLADYARRAEWRNDGVDVVGRAMWEILRATRG